ncbi:MAG: response regulator transcription factor [Anaerolineaceae bacterium]|nr:response regulator transcription factor [Anaerolineaceae bacterium]
MPTTLLISDDQPLVRSGMRSELMHYPEFSVVGEAADADETIRQTLHLQPDILILEIQMANVNLLDLNQVYRREFEKNLRVVVITSNHNPETIELALISGARGYVLKEEEPAVIIEAIRMAMEGKLWLSPAAVKLMTILLAAHSAKNILPLSERELEILSLLGQGMKNTQVAGKLSIAERTVRYHVEQVINKLGVNNRVEAVAKATQNGWISYYP